MHEILPWQRLPVPGSSGDCVKANSATFMQLSLVFFQGKWIEMDPRWQPWLLRQCQNVMGEA